MTHWSNPTTGPAYAAFDARWGRYDAVNRALADHAQLREGLSVLDVGAGTGGTQRALSRLQPLGITSVEPSDSMWGAAGLEGPRVRDLDQLGADRFDRVVAGSSVWLLGALPEAIEPLLERVKPGGALCFGVPAGYLGEPDGPGGGADPWLTQLASLLTNGRAQMPEPGSPLPSAEQLDAWLAERGRVERWEATWRWTSEALRDWTRLPPIGRAMRPDLTTEQLDVAIEAAWTECDQSSWRDERWLGWTVWI